ncbi:MAG: ParB/RepB/Spo0J family partition protein [Candidatus Scatovivens sp.]
MKEDLYNKFVEKQEQKEIEEQKNLINKKQEIVMIDVNLLDEFNNHIFSAISQSKFEELKESVSRSGVLSPIIIRRKQDRYEIISGHNRTRCCKELGIKEIPTIIKDYDDDMAELIMIETNLAQRENILPCEKGLAYKKRLELIKKISKENGLETSNSNEYMEKFPVGTLPSLDKLADESNDSRTQIQRFIRLTELNNDLKNKVNNDVIGIRAGVELSYIKPEEQIIVNDIIDENNLKITTAQAQKLRAVYGTITRDNVMEIIKGKPKKKEDKFTGRLLKNIFKKYKDKFANDKEFSELIDILLENHYKNLSDERRTN